MKTIKIIILGLLLAHTCIAANNSPLVIKGKISPEKSIKLLYRSYCGDFDKYTTINLVPDNNGNILYQNARIQTGYYSIGLSDKIVFLEPGMQIQILEKGNELVIEGEYQYMNEMFEYTTANTEILDLLNKRPSLSFEDYEKAVDAFVERQRGFIDKIKHKKIRKLEHERLDFAANLFVFSYVSFHKEALEKVKHYRGAFTFNSERILIFPEWKNIFEEFFKYERIYANVDYFTSEDLMFQLKYITNERLKEEWGWYRINKLRVYTNLTYQWILALRELVSDSLRLSFLDKKLKEHERLIKGSFIPNFVFCNENGDKITLRDFEGKYIYMYCFGLHCPACVAELPNLKALYEKYKDNDKIVFISVCTENNIELWKKHLKQHNINFVNLILDKTYDYWKNEIKFSEYFQVAYIPRFLFISREGKIINVDAERPNEMMNVLPLYLK